MKYIVLLMLCLAAGLANSCVLSIEATHDMLEDSKGVYLGYVTSLRVESIEGIAEDSFPPAEITGLYDRKIKLSIVETLLGEPQKNRLVELDLSWCGDPNVLVGEKVVAFFRNSGNWEIKRIGVNPLDIQSQKP